MFKRQKMKKDLEEKVNKILINAGDLSFRRRVVEIINILDIKENETILDCGCGDGFYLVVLRNLYPTIKIVGLDYDDKILLKAKEFIKKDSLTEILKGRIENLPFKDEFFNKIILSEVLEHLDDDAYGLKEIYRVLKNKGKLIITVPNHNYPFFWDPLNWIRERLGLGHFNKDNETFAGLWSMHLRLYYPKEIKKLVEEAGFKINKIKMLTHYCFPFSQIILHLGKQYLRKMAHSKKVTDTMEKFNWNAENKESIAIFRFGQKLLEKIDNYNNEKIFDINVSSHGILLLCQKL